MRRGGEEGEESTSEGGRDEEGEERGEKREGEEGRRGPHPLVNSSVAWVGPGRSQELGIQPVSHVGGRDPNF